MDEVMQADIGQQPTKLSKECAVIPTCKLPKDISQTDSLTFCVWVE